MFAEMLHVGQIPHFVRDDNVWKFGMTGLKVRYDGRYQEGIIELALELGYNVVYFVPDG